MKPASPSSPSVVILVLNWNGLDFTTACYRALRRLDSPAAIEILIIDNGSTENSPDDLREACPGASILPLPENRGFAAGMNAGIRYALRKNADFVWLLNNDTVCEPTALASLLGPMENARTALVASRLKQTDGGKGIAPGIVHRGGSSLRPPFYIPFPLRKDKRPDFLCGASLLIRSAALREIGPLDEGFPFFFEDADYSFRAKAKGWEIVESPLADVIHMGSATIGRMNRKKAESYRFGHVRFLRRHSPCPRLTTLPALFWRLLVDGIRLDGAAIAGNISGFRDGWRHDLSIQGDIL